MPPRRTYANGSVFIQPEGPTEVWPTDGTEPAGWLARIADGPQRGTAVAAERFAEDLLALVDALGLPRRNASVRLEPVDDFAAANREVLVAERKALRRAMETGCLVGTVAGVLGAILLAWAFVL